MGNRTVKGNSDSQLYCFGDGVETCNIVSKPSESPPEFNNTCMFNRFLKISSSFSIRF